MPANRDIRVGAVTEAVEAKASDSEAAVIDEHVRRPLIGLTPEQLKRPLETITASPLPGLRLIPYRAVGAENGLLLAMRFPSVCLGGRRGPGIVAFAPQVFEEDYQREHLQCTVDNLNLLYVAFTRPKKNLVVIGKRRSKNSKNTANPASNRSDTIEHCLQELSNRLPESTLTGADSDSECITFTFGLATRIKSILT